MIYNFMEYFGFMVGEADEFVTGLFPWSLIPLLVIFGVVFLSFFFSERQIMEIGAPRWRSFLSVAGIFVAVSLCCSGPSLLLSEGEGAWVALPTVAVILPMGLLSYPCLKLRKHHRVVGSLLLSMIALVIGWTMITTLILTILTVGT